MTFYDDLSKKVKIKEKDLLPRRYNLLGKILLVKLKPELFRYRRRIGKAILELIPYVHTVCLDNGVSGKTRKPSIEVIAGCKDTETLHTEYGCKFFLDVSQNMWSKGNKGERARMKKIKKGEVIIDMFAGIGYWSVFVAKNAKKVYAIDINPKAIKYLEKNIWINKVENKVEVLKGDCRKYSDLLENTGDRIIMGYFDTKKFLPYAVKMAKKNAIIHYHDVCPIDKLEELKNYVSKFGKIIDVRKIKSYSPKVAHFVIDLRV
ncbi:MAG: class I SAM-dependent methyltransferase family protein [Candidatus Aenigmarchaeota archaeon]|nr:class I SAM-dependent methyltransferase family protein [Candidatus Aenigmarchaeota archaeon]